MIRHSLFCAAASIALVSCFPDSPESGETSDSKTPSGFVKASDLVIDEASGIATVEGAAQPYTGPVITRNAAWEIKYFAQYENGLLNGPELRYYDGGTTIRRWYDWLKGEKIRHREFWESGQIKLDAMTKDGEAYGKHQTWDEKGMMRFDGSFVENLQWDGPIKDVDAEGNVMWDAIFERGRYVSGVYPKQEEQNLIDAGMLDPETLEPIAKPEVAE